MPKRNTLKKRKSEGPAKKVSPNKEILLVDSFVKIYKTSIDPIEKRQALENIIKAFDTYFWKYIHLFKGDKMDLKSKDTFVFLNLFLAGRPRTPETLQSVLYLIKQVGSKFEPEDLYNTFVLIFVGSILEKYTIMEGINFTMYGTKIFRYRVKDWCTKISKDPECRAIPFTELEIDISEEDRADYTIKDPVERIRTNWDLGWIKEPKNPIFKDLTHVERHLLYMLYEQDLSVKQIAEALVLTTKEALLMTKKVQEKIKNLINERDRTRFEG